MGWEMHAYDCMGVDYFYLGDMEKCNYYHDRIVRGKFESEDSVLKSVTMSTIRSKREVYHSGKRKRLNKDFSMKNESKRKTDFGLSKSIMLLPYYAGPEASFSLADVAKSSSKTGTTSAQAAGKPKQQLNYLKPAESRIKKRPVYKPRGSYLRSKSEVPRFSQQEETHWEPFTEKRYRALIKNLKMKKISLANPQTFRRLSHNSRLRVLAVTQISSKILFENLSEILEVFRLRLKAFVIEEVKKQNLGVKYENIVLKM